MEFCKPSHLSNSMARFFREPKMYEIIVFVLVKAVTLMPSHACLKGKTYYQVNLHINSCFLNLKFSFSSSLKRFLQKKKIHDYLIYYLNMYNKQIPHYISSTYTTILRYQKYINNPYEILRPIKVI